MPYTSKLWSSLPLAAFPSSRDFHVFKRGVSAPLCLFWDHALDQLPLFFSFTYSSFKEQRLAGFFLFICAALGLPPVMKERRQKERKEEKAPSRSWSAQAMDVCWLVARSNCCFFLLTSFQRRLTILQSTLCQSSLRFPKSANVITETRNLSSKRYLGSSSTVIVINERCCALWVWRNWLLTLYSTLLQVVFLYSTFLLLCSATLYWLGVGMACTSHLRCILCGNNVKRVVAR